MNLLFWNVQRLGNGTSPLKNDTIEQVIAGAFWAHGAELALLCEISADSTIGDVPVSKQVQVRKRGALKQAAQLGYTAMIQDDLVLDQYSVPNFSEVFDGRTWKKGGSDFSKQSKRFVAFAGYLDAVNVYVYHANASPRASFLVGWVAEALRQEHDGNFLLVGDFNCDKTEVIKDLIQSYTQGGVNVNEAIVLQNFKFEVGGEDA